MTQVYIEFIKSVLGTIDFWYEREQYEVSGNMEQYNAIFEEKRGMVKRNYQWIEENGLVNGLLSFLENEYGDDDGVYLNLMHYQCH